MAVVIQVLGFGRLKFGQRDLAFLEVARIDIVGENLFSTCAFREPFKDVHVLDPHAADAGPTTLLGWICDNAQPKWRLMLIIRLSPRASRLVWPQASGVYQIGEV